MGTEASGLSDSGISPNCSHIVVFVHGFGSSGPQHGKNIKQQFDKKYGPKEQVYICESNSGSFGPSTFLKTSQGIEIGGNRIADEILQIFSTHPNLSEISFIGSSLGGLYSRYAIKSLFSNPAFSKITPRIFLTLETPHLGIRGIYHASGQDFLPWIPSGRELTLDDSPNFQDCLLWNLSGPGFTESLSRFQHRVSYAPIEDDGIVSYPTSAFALSPDKTVDQGVIRKIREIDSRTQFDSPWFQGDVACQTLIHMRDHLASLKWTLIDVQLDHRKLATLYPSTSERPNHWTNPLLEDMFSRIEQTRTSVGVSQL